MKKLLIGLFALCLGTTSYAQSTKQSAYFDSSNYIHIGTASPLSDNTHRKLTVEAWVKQNELIDSVQTIIYIPTFIPTEHILDIHIQGNTLSGSYGNVTLSCPYVFDENWHHIALICDVSNGNDSLSFYIDGNTYVYNTVQMHTIVGTHSYDNTYIGCKQNSGLGESNYFKGNLCNVVITDTALYDTIINCMYDTANITYTGDVVTGKINYPTLLVAMLNSDSNNHSGYYVYVGNISLPTNMKCNETSPCTPIYTFSVDTAKYHDSIIFYAYNTNNSFNRGSYIPHTINGWDGSSTMPIYGKYIDTSLCIHVDTTISGRFEITLPYTNDTGGVVPVTGAKTIVIPPSLSNYVSNIYTDNNINIYPNPSSGIINYVSKQHANVSIYDLTGKCLYSEYNVIKTSVHLDKGIYILKSNDAYYKLLIE